MSHPPWGQAPQIEIPNKKVLKSHHVMCKVGKGGFEKVLWLLFTVVMTWLLWMVINLFYFVRFLTKN